MRSRAAAGILLGALFLTACGGKPATQAVTAAGGGPTGSVVPAASDAPSASPTPTVTPTPTPAGTQVLTYSMFNADGSLQTGLTVKDVMPPQQTTSTLPNFCGQGSGGDGPNTYMCGSTASGMPFCLQSPSPSDSPFAVYCVSNVWDTVVQRTVDLTLKPTADKSSGNPMGLELTDGSRWRLVVGGAWSPPPGYLVAYACVSGCTGQYEELLAPDSGGPAIDRSTPQWTIARGQDGGSAVTTGVVAKAWYLQGSAFRSGPKVIDFGLSGVEIASPSDVDKLGPDVGEGFKAYLREKASAPATGGCRTVYTVSKYRVDGFARGSGHSVGACGGGAPVIWSKQPFGWDVALVFQAVPLCSELKAKQIPSDMFGTTCGTEAGNSLYNHP